MKQEKPTKKDKMFTYNGKQYETLRALAVDNNVAFTKVVRDFNNGKIKKQ